MYYEKVLSCSPTRGITLIDGQLLHDMVTEVEALASGCRNVRRVVYARLRLAHLCRRLGHYHLAVTHYRLALQACLADDERHEKLRHQAEAEMAARGLDEVWHEAFGGREPSHMVRQVMRRYVVMYYDFMLNRNSALWDYCYDEGDIPPFVFTMRDVYCD